MSLLSRLFGKPTVPAVPEKPSRKPRKARVATVTKPGSGGQGTIRTTVNLSSAEDWARKQLPNVPGSTGKVYSHQIASATAARMTKRGPDKYEPRQVGATAYWTIVRRKARTAKPPIKVSIAPGGDTVFPAPAPAEKVTVAVKEGVFAAALDVAVETLQGIAKIDDVDVLMTPRLAQEALDRIKAMLKPEPKTPSGVSFSLPMKTVTLKKPQVPHPVTSPAKGIVSLALRFSHETPTQVVGYQNDHRVAFAKDDWKWHIEETGPDDKRLYVELTPAQAKRKGLQL